MWGTQTGAPAHRAVRPRDTATRSVVRALGVVAAVAGIEHGVGEVVQGGAAAGVVIRSWPDAAAFEPLDGEPAMTLLPDLRDAGLVTIVLSLGLAWWSLRTRATRRDGWWLLGLTAVLLLVGGGFGPPLVSLTLAVALLAQPAPGAGAATEVGGRWRRRLAQCWRVLLGVTVAAFLALFPGVVVLRGWFGVDGAVLVAILPVVAFGALALSLVAARAHDRTVPPAAAQGPGVVRSRP